MIDGKTGQSLTFGELIEQIDCLAAFLGKIELGKGDVMAIFAPNLIQYPLAMFAGVRAGVTVTTANPGYTATELGHQLRDSRASALFCDAQVLSTAQEAAKIVGIPLERIFVFGNEKVDGHLSIGHAITMARPLVSSSKFATYSQEECLHGQAAYLCYSSGTTGKSMSHPRSSQRSGINTRQYCVQHVSGNYQV